MADAPVAVNIFQLESSDKILFEISEKALMLSTTLGNLVVDLQMAEKAPEDRDPIPLSNINGAILAMVVHWCEHHKDDEPVARTRKYGDVTIPEWDQEFFKIDSEKLFELIRASDFLHIEKLLDLGCLAVANMSIDKSPEELRQIYDIPDDDVEEQQELQGPQEAEEHDDGAGPSNR